jgi:hypothetical protein
MLQARSNQFAQLLRESVRLSTYAAEGSGAPQVASKPPARLRKRIESRLSALREELGNALHSGNGQPEPPVAEAAAEPEAESSMAYGEVLTDLPELVAEAIPAGATVLVVSKGDERLLRMPGRHAWHFPRAEDGRYAGYYPKTSEDAVQHLEALRGSGAEFLVIPSTYLWWLKHYEGLAQHLEERYETLTRAECGLVIDLRGGALSVRNGGSTAANASTDAAAHSSDGALSAEDYSRLIERIRQVVDTVLPPHAKVLVVSRGDDELIELGGRSGWHFPRQDDGSYMGYHPADDEAAITHLEQLRARGAEYLLLPSAAFWWLDYYRGFADHLQERYTTVAYEPDSCLVYELSERFLSDVVRALVPEDSRIAVLSRYSGDVAGLPSETTTALTASEADSDAVDRLEQAVADGVNFLVIPRTMFGWLEQHPDFSRYLRTRHWFVTRQELACELYELSAEPSGTARGAAEADAPSAAGTPRDHARGWFRRLFGSR